MDEHLARDKILKFVRPGILGHDIIDIRRHLGSPPWDALKALLDKMANESLLKKEERRVVGSRLATFYMPGNKMSLATNASDFPKGRRGRRKSWSRTKQPA